MIIFGTRVRHKVIAEGQFFCPKCQAMRTYQHKVASRYFSLYFIPILPVGRLGEFVECQACGVAFKPLVLQQARPLQPRHTQVDLAALLNALPERLQNGTPVEFLSRDLTAAGLDRDRALALIEAHLGTGRKTCESCALTFASTVRACSECHRAF